MNIYKERIRPLFDSSGLTNAELEREIGIPPKTINKWDSGYVSSYIKYIAQIAKFFDVNPYYLLGKSNEKKPVYENVGGLGETRYDLLTPEHKKIVVSLIEQLLDFQSGQ